MMKNLHMASSLTVKVNNCDKWIDANDIDNLFTNFCDNFIHKKRSRDGKPAGGVIAACGDRVPTRVELHTVDVGGVALVLVQLLFLKRFSWVLMVV